MPSQGLCLGWNSGWGASGGLAVRNDCRELAAGDGGGIIAGDCGRLGFSVRAGEFTASRARGAGSGLGRAVVILDSPLKAA